MDRNRFQLDRKQQRFNQNRLIVNDAQAAQAGAVRTLGKQPIPQQGAMDAAAQQAGIDTSGFVTTDPKGNPVYSRDGQMFYDSVQYAMQNGASLEEAIKQTGQQLSNRPANQEMATLVGQNMAEVKDTQPSWYKRHAPTWIGGWSSDAVNRADRIKQLQQQGVNLFTAPAQGQSTASAPQPAQGANRPSPRPQQAPQPAQTPVVVNEGWKPGPNAGDHEPTAMIQEVMRRYNVSQDDAVAELIRKGYISQ